MNEPSTPEFIEHRFFRRLSHIVITPPSGTVIPSLFCVAILVTPLSRTAMTYLMPDDWQISGNYLDGLHYGFLLAMAAAWLLSIAMLFGRRQWKRGLLRIIAIPATLVLASVIAVIPMLFLPSTISGWPIDSVHSASRDKYFILAYEPIPTDVAYRVFSAGGSRLNPVWRVEFAGTTLDYSEDGSLTEDPHLILSEDEQLLVIARGGHLTDALLLDSKQPLAQSISFADEDREQQWQRRTDRIRALLTAHKGPARPSVADFSESTVRARLRAWCDRMVPELTQALPENDWNVTCAVEEVGPTQAGRRKVAIKVTCTKGDARHNIIRHMTLVEDSGRFVIVDQDTGLAWSDSEKRMLCEQVRFVLLDIAGSGTYLDRP